MKKVLLPLLILLLAASNATFGQNIVKSTVKYPSTSVGFVISTNDVETVWNALRLANYSKNEGDTVTVFLLGKGVELDSLVVKNNDLREQVDNFTANGGIILGCGTCLNSRNYKDPKICKFSSMKDLYALTRKNRIVLTF